MQTLTRSAIVGIGIGVVLGMGGGALSPLSVRAQSTDTSPANMVAYFATQSACPEGWTEATYLQGRLALGITDTSAWPVGKTVGTALANETAPSHAHPFAVSLTLKEQDLSGGDCGSGDGGGAKKGAYTVNGPSLSDNTCQNSDSGLPLLQILACERKNTGQAQPDGYGTAALAFFNRSSCPTNWIPATGFPQAYQAVWNGTNDYQVVITFAGADRDNDGVLRGRGSDPSKIQGGKTNELSYWTMVVSESGATKATYTWAQQKARSDFNFNYAIADKQVYASVWATDEDGLNVGIAGTNEGDYNLFSNTAAGGIWLVLQNDNNSNSTSSLGNTEFADRTPVTPVTTSVNGYFVMPFETPPDGTVGKLVGSPYANGEQRTHTHTLSSSIKLAAKQYEKFAGKCKELTTDGTHTFSGTTDAVFNNVPYTQLLLCEREPNLLGTNPPTGVPTNVVTSFASQKCPTGWKPSATGSGRFFVGLPDGGTEDQAFGAETPLQTPGKRPQHCHGLKGSVNIPQQEVILAAGTDSTIVGHSGTYDYGGSTDAGDFGLPYLTVANCQPCVENDSNPVCQEQAKQN